MKTKKINKKLTLNKTTISDLKPRDLNTVKGGTNTIPRTICHSIYRTCQDC
jgi:natural product precursor